MAAEGVFQLSSHSFDYKKYPGSKAFSFLGCSIVMGMLIAKRLRFQYSTLLADAALATGLSLAAVTFVAYGGPDENYFKWAGPLAFICTGLLFAAYMGLRNY